MATQKHSFQLVALSFWPSILNGRIIRIG